MIYIKAAAYGGITFGVCIPMFATLAVKLGFGLLATIGFTVGMSAAVGTVAAAVGVIGSQMAGGAVKEVLSGSSTPYLEQFSYEQALVMQRRVPDALRSYEGHIAKPGSGVDVRIRAADLYAADGGDPKRAAELFREAQRHQACTVGQDVYAANRLFDLLNGPLDQPGKALGELRRLIDRHPNSAAAANAREALARLKTSG